jgi:hypothetical protein
LHARTVGKLLRKLSFRHMSVRPLSRDNQNHVVSDNQRHIHQWNIAGLDSRLSGPQPP